MATPIAVTFLRDTHHGGTPDQAHTVATRLAEFVAAARYTLDLAIYDFRLSDPLAKVVVDALTTATTRGVAVRIAFDAGKPPAATHTTFTKLQADPAPVGTADWVRQHFDGTAVQTKAITAPSGQLMHSKYLVRDPGHRHAAIWTGSANFTDDAWTRQENNLLTITSAALARSYRVDFDQLWTAGSIGDTGHGDTGTTTVGGVSVGWDFAPGDGQAIDTYLVDRVNSATRRIVISSMVLTSHPLLAALAAALGRGVPVSGIYDAGQMGPIARDWAGRPGAKTVLANWNAVKAHLVGKRSTPYTPTSVHDFMHNKVIVTDNEVDTGSYNLSANAQRNAENQLHIRDHDIAERYVDYVQTISAAYIDRR